MSSAMAPGTGPIYGQGGTTIASQLSTFAWGIAVATGMISILVGIAMLVWPEATVGVIAVLFGIQLLIQGVYRIAQAIVADVSGGARVLYAFLGVLCFAVGVLALRHLLQTAAVLAILFGLFWLVGGVIEFVSVLSDRDRGGRAGALTLAAISVLVGVLVLAYPALSLKALVWIIGIWLIVWGVLTMFVTLMIRHMDKQAAAAAK